MSEKYFPGFTFKLPNEEENFQLSSKIDRIPASTPRPVEIVALSKFDEDSELDEMTESELGWEFSQVMSDFNRVLSNLSSRLDNSFTMENKSVQLVTPDDVLPKTERERSQLVESYGKYILDGIVGICSSNSDGSFDIKIGYAGREETSIKDDVLEVLSHEFGHTLGEQLPDPIFEELKAYTFSNLFMRHYSQVDAIFDLPLLSSEKTHHIAKHYLDLLLSRNIPEEAILAHLTGENFGTYTADMWNQSDTSSRNIPMPQE